ncbi:hypothetical protein LXL04_010602 [Taraxacum kok-saghyz]
MKQLNLVPKSSPDSPIPNPNPRDGVNGGNVTDLGNGSDVVYIPWFLTPEKSWEYFHYLNKHIPWTRPTIRVFGKPCLQPRDVCYIASEGLKELSYSGYKPNAYSWDVFPPLKEILDEVHKAFPGSQFNSLLLNRYNNGNDYVGWHSDDEKLYGNTPEIASISFGCERDFLLKKRREVEGEGPKTRTEWEKPGWKNQNPDGFVKTRMNLSKPGWIC